LDLLTRLIVHVAPGWAMRRAIARERYDMILEKRTYDAARHSRATSGWRRPSTSANAEIYGGLIALRNGSREMVRNNPLAGRALRVVASNTVSTGFEIEPRTKDKATNVELRKLYADHCAACDYAGQLNKAGLEYLAVCSMLEGGETIIRKQIVKDRRLPVPLQYQLLEGDYLSHYVNGVIDGVKTFQGIAVGDDGKRAGYWLFAEHPGEQIILKGSADFAATLVDADLIYHFYEVQRIGQMRGVPWLTAGMVKARDLDGYEESEIVRKRIEACVAAIVVGLDPNADPASKGITPMVRDARGDLVESFSPGLIALATGTKDVKFTQPAATSGYAEFKRAGERTLSSAWRTTYEQLTNDFSQNNFTGFKAGLNQFKREVEVLQWNFAIPMFVSPMYRDFVDMAILRGRIKELPDGSTYDHEVNAPRVGSVDALNDAKTDLIELRSFLKSPQQALRSRGEDPDTVLEQITEWHQKLVANGVVSDADPALAPKAGAATGAGSGDGGGASADAAARAAELEPPEDGADREGYERAMHDGPPARNGHDTQVANIMQAVTAAIRSLPAPEVNVTVPITIPKASGATRTVVTKRGPKGIEEFERHEIGDGK
jgi:lambda family phage portal protein